MAERSHKFKLTSPKAFILLAKLIKNKNHLKGGKEKHATGFRNPETTGYKGISFLIIQPAKQDAASVFLPSPPASRFSASAAARGLPWRPEN